MGASSTAPLPRVLVESRAAPYGWPSVAFDGSDYQIVWAETSYSAKGGVYAARLSPSDGLVDAPMLVAPAPTAAYGWLGQVAYPALASSGGGTLTAWLQIVSDKSIVGAFVYPPASR